MSKPESPDAYTTIRSNSDGASQARPLAETERVALGRADRLAVLGQLASGLAHEINTPLGSISAHAEESLELLDRAQDGKLTPEQISDLKSHMLAIMRQTNRCSTIATRLLQFAHAPGPIGQTCHPRQVIHQVVELLGPTAQGLGVRLQTELEGSLPEVPMGAAELEQVLINLVQNGLDACQPGDSVCIEARAEDGNLCIVVADTGCGIPRETLSRIFDPFFTTKPVGKGTGLGLSVCLGIVRAAGGTIEVASAPGKGTQVTLNIPTQPTRLSAAGPEANHSTHRRHLGSPERGACVALTPAFLGNADTRTLRPHSGGPACEGAVM